MLIRNTNLEYGIVSQCLHWITVILVFIQIVLGHIGADLPLGMQRLIILSRHKSVGMTIFMLVILRIIWRLINKVPELPPNMTRLNRSIALITHWSFYILLVCMPIAGWISSSASNLSVSWFGLFTWPDLVEPDKHLADIAKTTHIFLSWVLVSLITLHILAALKHHFIDKDNILLRMLIWPGSK